MKIIVKQPNKEIMEAWGAFNESFLEDVPTEISITSSKWRTDPVAENHVLFQTLSREWKMATAGLPRVRDKIRHESYSRITAWGMEAVPNILADLANSDEPSHWFEALHEITGADPVSEQDRGNLRRMARAWIEWGRNRSMID